MLLRVVFLVSVAFAAEPTDYSRLRTDILQGYDKNARPAQSIANSTVVRVNVLLRGFEFDEKRQILTIFAWTVMSWKDTHMKWDPKNYGNITKTHFAAHEIWQPDLSVYNNLDQSEIDHFGNTRVLAFSTGSLVWVPPTKLQVGCSTNLRRWPNDVQSCVVVLGSWAHDGSAIDLRLYTNVTSMKLIDFVENREWALVDNAMVRRVTVYAGAPGVFYPDIRIAMTVVRRGSSHSAALFVPALAIAAILLISFWVPPTNPERVGLLLIAATLNALYLQFVYTAIPNNGDSVPLMILFFRDSLVMVTAALIWTVGLRYLASSKRTSPVPLPSAITGFLSSWVAKALCLDPRPSGGSSGGNDDEGKLVEGGGNQADWAWLAHLLDRFAFAIYLLIYIIFCLSLL